MAVHAPIVVSGSSENALHEFLVLGDLIQGLRESLDKYQVRVVGIELQDFLERHVRVTRLPHPPCLQVCEEIFRLNDLDLARVLLPWRCPTRLLLGLD